ncbi:MAG: hypothetical protein ISS19_04790 [Bacteroidales bacterium]|nr:hypothetical protein [Bacteroidales bacterium]
MKKPVIILVTIFVLSLVNLKAQEIYPKSSGELLFQFADVELANGTVTNKPMRFTMFLHLGQYWHFDIGNYVGFYTGTALRNVGFIYDDNIPQKTIRRAYAVGVPLGLKLGSFKHNIYFLGGAEYEMLFHYKAKRWYSNERDGSSIKDSEWFSDKTKLFVPSVFAGIQFPGGVNLKFKYYLGDFLNLDYVGNDLGNSNVSFSDYTKLEVFYISLSWQFRTDKIKEGFSASETQALR